MPAVTQPISGSVDCVNDFSSRWKGYSHRYLEQTEAEPYEKSKSKWLL